jgi:hypothetical protein
MWNPDERNRSLADQFADALSPDPSKRTVAGHTLADQVSQGLTNDLTGNHPGGLFGGGAAASQGSQALWDEVLRSGSEGEDT